jgi:hypothetical protein
LPAVFFSSLIFFVLLFASPVCCLLSAVCCMLPYCYFYAVRCAMRSECRALLVARCAAVGVTF